MTNPIKTYTTSLVLKLDSDKISFLKSLTKIEDLQEAGESFAVICLNYGLDPNYILDLVKKPILEEST